MVEKKNIIRKQTVNFQYNGKADGFALQKEVDDWCKSMLIPEIEQQLELFDLDDNYIIIDKLEIDAVIDKKDWQQKIRNELILSLNKKLVNYKPVFKTPADKTETVSKKLDELIIFYFEKGFLPWWGKALMETDLRTIMHNWVTEEMSQTRAADIITRLQQITSLPVVERIINQVPPQIYFQFLKNIFKTEAEIISQAESFFNEVIPVKMPIAKKAAIKKAVHGFVLNMMIKKAEKLDTALLFQFIYEALKMHKAVSLLKPVAEFLVKENKISKQKISEPAKKDEDLNYNKIIDELKATTKTGKPEKELAAFVQEGIYIENAGVVIIAAFIPTLFEKLKISKNHIIINADLAAMIIQYAVTGNTKMEEHELVIPKILCGIDLGLPVNTGKRLTAGQSKEADDMLSAVIEYWAIIKDTSVPGLRASFLQRGGKLSLINNEWLLQVEQRPYDMLLQQLPWSISMIKLPWMSHLLKTEWIY